jgi:phosphopantothenate-cysteine ligase/phosphopantothenoylcysteine decarboxylase/phosphopantothenate--cysteine ligase
MRILVTAGNTQAPIDRVRYITNIFTGRTGTSIALEAYRRGHDVTLLTSHPEVIDAADPDPHRWHCLPYRTFGNLEDLMISQIALSHQDAVIHCAAVSDYHCDGVFTRPDGGPIDRSTGKIKSDEPELWLRLRRAPKLIDKIRSLWEYRGLLVKFKLEVDVNDAHLLDIAEKSRHQSAADWMVANTLDGAREWAFLGNERGYRKIARPDLAAALLDVIESESPHA